MDSSAGKANVYEALNKTLREIYVGIAYDEASWTRQVHLKSPPARLTHWDYLRHEIVYRDVERDLAFAHAYEFLRQYWNATPIPGWRRICEIHEDVDAPERGR